MNIAVIGTGYVGLVTGVCLSEIGNHVTCIDIDENKIFNLKKGLSPIYEEGLEDLLNKNLSQGNLQFTSDYVEGLNGKDLVYIAVGTPQGDDGSADLTYIDSACLALAEHLTGDVVIVTKSTVPIGTNDYIEEKVKAHLTNNISVRIVSNPEFLRQGSAVRDTFHGDRIVIGSADEEALSMVEKVNAPFNIPILKTDLKSAEMIKYASNAFLATKISFINEVANLCERLGANIDNVSQGMGMDQRIGKSFLNAGIGYGGSCFPKDTNALIAIGEMVGYSMPLVENTVAVNEMQREIIVDKVLQQCGSVKGKKVALLGLAFKSNTDDMREAPSIVVSKRLLDEKAIIHAYDPVATENAKHVLPKGINYATSIQEAITGADIAIILTEWNEIKAFSLENYAKYMTEPVVFDGRNCFTLENAQKYNVEYHSIGRPVLQMLQMQTV